MRTLLKSVEAIGIAITGLGLIMGVVSNAEGKEFMYAGMGILVFWIARFVETRLPE